MVVLGLSLLGELAGAERLRVAVASNFAEPMRELVAAYEQSGKGGITAVFGSTGKHYAQIVNGAPFQVFVAADAEHPRRLESQGLAIRGSRFTYAVGRLVLWSPRPDYVDSKGAVLEHGGFRHLAIAHPELAPYGIAARQTLEALALWERLQDRLVRGENIGHSFHFVMSGSAELGFVALSQVKRPGQPILEGSYWEVPEGLHQPIEQQAVLLVDSEAARRFLAFLAGGAARAIMHGYGYLAPGARQKGGDSSLGALHRDLDQPRRPLSRGER